MMYIVNRPSLRFIKLFIKQSILKSLKFSVCQPALDHCARVCCTGGVLICYRVTSTEELTDLIRFVSHIIANQKSMNID